MPLTEDNKPSTNDLPNENCKRFENKLQTNQNQVWGIRQRTNQQMRDLLEKKNISVKYTFLLQNLEWEKQV